MLPLRFDFGLYENNNLVGLVEFHGKQHFKPIAYYGGEKAFDKQKKRDTIKVDFCFRNDIALLIIPYNDYQKIDWLLDKFWKDIISETKRTLATRFSCRM